MVYWLPPGLQRSQQSADLSFLALFPTSASLMDLVKDSAYPDPKTEDEVPTVHGKKTELISIQTLALPRTSYVKRSTRNSLSVNGHEDATNSILVVVGSNKKIEMPPNWPSIRERYAKF